MSTLSLETGAVHVDLENATCSGSASVNAPLVRYAGDGATVRVASPADEITLAVVLASYVLATPGTNGSNDAGAPRVSDSVAGTEPPTVPCTGGAVTLVMPSPSNCTQFSRIALFALNVRNRSLVPSTESGNVSEFHLGSVVDGLPVLVSGKVPTISPVCEPLRRTTLPSAPPTGRLAAASA